MFAVTGITGQVGSVVARSLLQAGHDVRAVVRDEHKSAVWADQGCDVSVVLPLLRRAPAGRIVNVSSILGSLSLHAAPGVPLVSEFAYGSSKTALNALTIYLAHALRDTRIKVNSAHPGWVKAELGGPGAELELSEGGKTSAALALLDENGPTGGFFHLGAPVPW